MNTKVFVPVSQSLSESTSVSPSIFFGSPSLYLLFLFLPLLSLSTFVFFCLLCHPLSLLSPSPLCLLLPSFFPLFPMSVCLRQCLCLYLSVSVCLCLSK